MRCVSARHSGAPPVIMRAGDLIYFRINERSFFSSFFSSNNTCIILHHRELNNSGSSSKLYLNWQLDGSAHRQQRVGVVGGSSSLCVFLLWCWSLHRKHFISWEVPPCHLAVPALPPASAHNGFSFVIHTFLSLPASTRNLIFFKPK